MDTGATPSTCWTDWIGSPTSAERLVSSSVEVEVEGEVERPHDTPTTSARATTPASAIDQRRTCFTAPLFRHQANNAGYATAIII
jgi:hypothetical protein